MFDRSLADPSHGGDRRRRRVRRPVGSRVHIVVGLVCSAYDLTPAQIYGGSRGRARIAFARQVAMYMAHIWLGLSLSEIGRRFGRDRTTVAHACSLVEDRRDDPIVDATLNVIETAAASWQDLARDCEAA